MVEKGEVNERNYGIDILRVVSMMMIVVLHILYHGNALDGCVPNSFNYYFLNCILTIVWCGVDIFAIISGFVGFKSCSNNSLAGYIRLWFRVAFINFLITALFSFLHPGEVDTKQMMLSLLPVSSKAYWYFTAYSFVYLLSPAISQVLLKTDNKEDKFILCLGLILLYFSHSQTGLFSIALLVYLYCLGSMIKKYNLHLRVSPKKSITIILISILFTWLWNVLISPINSTVGGIWLRYDSPTIIGISALSVMLFARKPIGEHTRKLIGLVTPSIFSVYLVNDNQTLRHYLISDRFSWFSDANPFAILGTIILAIVAYFVGTVLFDFIRRWIENKVKIVKICRILESMARKMSVTAVNTIKIFIS